MPLEPIHEIDLDPSEADTRRLLIDTQLSNVGWIKGKDWFEEQELRGMPNSKGVGFADYVLFHDKEPYAVVEAKRTSVDPFKGQQQAKLYADLLEKKYAFRPLIFLTNGYDTYVWDDGPRGSDVRKISGVYSKADLRKYFNLRSKRISFAGFIPNKDIADRWYQTAAVKEVCKVVENNGRKALLVMATGSGKTRVAFSIIQALVSHNYVKNVLFLADRLKLVSQPYGRFRLMFKDDIKATNLCLDDHNDSAQVVFSTYQTMRNIIDKARNNENELVFTPGHFDLIITDEAHRSIYRKFKSIFDYFDAFILGLTATPKSDIHRDTYQFFNLPKDMPTYAYEYSQGVKDGHLVDYKVVKTSLNLVHEGVYYFDLTPEQQEQYEEIFIDDFGNFHDFIPGSQVNKKLFNTPTIELVLKELMSKGLRIKYGTQIGKTIIFAKNHKHALKIREVFYSLYPTYSQDFCRVIDYETKYVDSLMDDFDDPDKEPVIAISVDMLDTGVDIEEILNLVFFKEVYSKSKFLQMIGRGTR